MTITDTPMLRRIEEALSRSAGKRQRGRRPPTASASTRATTTRAMVEAGLSERDAVLLQEGDAHERSYAATLSDPARLHVPEPSPELSRAAAVLAEAVESTALTMPSMTGWTAEGDGASTYAHAQHGRLKLGAGRWTRHHATTGRILASGTTQESLGNHLRGLVGDTGNAAAGDANAEALAVVVARVRRNGAPVVPEGLHTRLHEAIVRGAGRETVPGGPSLHERLRKAVTR